MLVNGRTRQACSTLVDRLLADQPGEIELRPMSKFPVLRDLCVDRSRMFRTLEKVEGLDSGSTTIRTAAPARASRTSRSSCAIRFPSA